MTSTITGDPAIGTTNYTYDPLARLTTYTPPSASTAKAQTYGWNAMPDRTSITNGPTGSQATTAYDAASRPTGAYASDDQGRITTMPGTHVGETLTLSWDLLGRLAQVISSQNGTTSYAYDPLDRLETIVAPTGKTVFAYVGLTDAIATSTTGSQTTVHATDLDGTELYEYAASTTPTPVYLQRNTHGDVTWTTNEAGAPTGNAAYDPFGTLAASSGSIPSTRWQSSYQDDSTGLYYVVARWYSPTLGCFLSDDPLAGDATLPQGRDPYAYGAGDPVDRGDLSGQSWQDYSINSLQYTDLSGPISGFTAFVRLLQASLREELLAQNRLPAYSLDTSVVGMFAEPKPTSKSEFIDWSHLCGPGAFRVVMAFAGNHLASSPGNPGWLLNDDGAPFWPSTTYTDPVPYKTVDGKPVYYSHAWADGVGSDGRGDGYMMYLAWKVPGYKGHKGVFWHSKCFKHHGCNPTSTSEDIAAAANYEYWGGGSPKGPNPFKWIGAYYMKSQTSFHDAVVRQLAVMGVPVLVSVMTKGLPSWGTTDLGHYISIVGYNDTKGTYEYVETCPRWTGCGHANEVAGGPNLFWVSQKTLYTAIHRNGDY
jgi:RHS repeat-associated protein